MRKSIFVKFLYSFILIIVFLLVPVIFFSSSSIKKHYMDTISNHLESQSKGMKALVTPLLGDPAKLDAVIKESGRETGYRLTVIDRNGQVLADSEEDPGTMEDHGNRVEIRQAYSGKTGRATRFSRTVRQEMLYVAVPLSPGDSQTAVIRTSMYIKDIGVLINDITVKLLKIVVVILLLTLLLAYHLSRSITSPIMALSEASQEIASGDFNVKLHFKNKDELGILAENFNIMTRKLDELFSASRESEDKIRGIIESFEESLFVVDKNNRISLSNSSFRQFTGKEVKPGDHLLDIISQPEIINLINRVRDTSSPKISEITLGRQVYLVSINFIRGTKECVTILHDITSLKQIETVKKDLVANVSHELRTPLTAIKGFIETMENQDSPYNKKYLTIIRNHTDRLINIVKDLITLSRIEDKSGAEVPVEMDLCKTIDNTMIIFSDKALEKKITLNADIPEKPVMIKGLEYRIEQLLINLLDNALKYTEKGSVTVSLKESGGNAVLSVKDTGIGIPQSRIQRIFERFYVVDKSRSRKTGGTGLGLSIVKHIAGLHEAPISIESEPGKGSTFTVTFSLLSPE